MEAQPGMKWWQKFTKPKNWHNYGYGAGGTPGSLNLGGERLVAQELQGGDTQNTLGSIELDAIVL